MGEPAAHGHPLGQEVLPVHGLLPDAPLHPDGHANAAAGIVVQIGEQEREEAPFGVLNTLLAFLRQLPALQLEFELAAAFESIQLSNAVQIPAGIALAHENREGYSSDESEAEEQEGFCPEVLMPPFPSFL